LKTVLHLNRSVFGQGFLVNGKGSLYNFTDSENNVITTPSEVFWVLSVSILVYFIVNKSSTFIFYKVLQAMLQ
jgi:hypothetical protein